jgi:Uma2 family endonuclease
MSTADLSKPQPAVTYPDSDGQPMAENTRQWEYLVIIKCGLEAVFRDRPDVFVAGNLFWYPVEGNNTIRQTLGVMVAFGRPRGHRGSYKRWEEGGIAPQVVFAILSPGNRSGEMIRKFKFYERYGVEEYYIYDPDDGELVGYERQGTELVEVIFTQGLTSPRLGVRFQLVGNDLELYGPDGSKFASYLELVAQKEDALREAAEQQQQAQAQAEQVARLRARLKELGLDPDA